MKRRGEITPVRDLFAKYRKNLQAPQKTVELEVIRLIGESYGINLREDQVTYTVNNRTVAFLVSSILRQELKKHHKDILDKLKARLGEKSAPHNII